MFNITYVPKEEIYPMFGCYISNGTIKIREDLPRCMQDFLLSHEELHGDDIEKKEGFIEKELESNWGGFIRHPMGFLVTVLWSLAPYRLKYYLKRIINRK